MSLLAYLTKTAEADPGLPGGRPASLREGIEPRPHQSRAIRRLLDNGGKMIMAHDTGTGKTGTSIMGQETLRSIGRSTKALVVTPAGLRKNYADAVGKFTNAKAVVADGVDGIDPTADYNVISFDALRRDPEGAMARSGADTLIVDEFQWLRNEDAATYRSMWAARQRAKNFMGLTASPINNRPDELASLLALSENNPNLTKSDFKNKFVATVGQATSFTGTERPLFGIKNEAAYAKAVYPKMDMLATADIPGNDMPKKDVKYVDVPMSNEQWRLYQLSLNRLGPVAEYIARRDANVSVKDADRIFTQIAQARQISNSIGMGRKDVTPDQSAQRTPKVQDILRDTEKHLATTPDGQVVLYTNLVNGGIDVLTAGLRQRGIDYALFIGKGTEVGPDKVTEVSRQQGVDDFKAGKKRVIVLSGAGAEGLDLKDSTAFYSLDGHFNPERVLQAEARSRRLGGQATRAPEQRVVDVRRYRSVAPWGERPGLIGRMFGQKSQQTTDEWMYNVAENKYRTNRQFLDTLRRANKYIRKET
ncbi:MAG: SNF2-related protein, partial [Myxococcota bacterium]